MQATAHSFARLALTWLLIAGQVLYPLAGHAQSAVDLSGKVSVQYSGLTHNRQTKTYDTVATITNVSADLIGAPMSLLLQSISAPGVTLSNATGISDNGKPVLNVAVPPAGLAPAAAPKVLLKFKNPTNQRFSFTHSVQGVIVPPPDTLPPLLSIVAPTGGATISQNPPVIKLSFSDAGSGVDAATLAFTLGDAPLAVSCTPLAGAALCAPTAPLPLGAVQLTASLQDKAGNTAQTLLAFTLVKATQPPIGSLPPDPATVAPALDPGSVASLGAATAFLYTGDNPIQTGVVPGTIDSRRAAVIRGKVAATDGSPLPGVKITILGHPEFGQTLSRADGVFDLAVNGGGTLVVRYEKDGHIPAQRQVNTVWQDYAIAADVLLLVYDSRSTLINLGSPDPIQVAAGNPVIDADGKRTATVFFPAGTAATMVKADGSTQPLASVTVRATEYTVGTDGPKRMPMPLPPSVGYTYAVELSIDEAVAAGAQSVSFDRPLPFYLENYLGFPVGMAVPAGHYDRSRGQWIPADDGRVIGILSKSNGIAELTVNRAGTPATADELAALGVTEAERIQLAARYEPGQTLWRVPITHFTPWDFNWPYGPPDGAGPPEMPEPFAWDEPDENPQCVPGSIIECQNQVLGERIALVGSPFALHYRSNRVPGHTYARDTLEIPLSGSRLPPGGPAHHALGKRRGHGHDPVVPADAQPPQPLPMGRRRRLWAIARRSTASENQHRLCLSGHVSRAGGVL